MADVKTLEKKWNTEDEETDDEDSPGVNAYLVNVESKEPSKMDTNNNKAGRGKAVVSADDDMEANIGPSGSGTSSALRKQGTTQEMVENAIYELKDRTGSSKSAIVKFIKSNYNINNEKVLGRNVQRFFKKGIDEGRLVMVKHSYKLSVAAKSEREKKLKAKEKQEVKKKPKAEGAKKGKTENAGTSTAKPKKKTATEAKSSKTASNDPGKMSKKTTEKKSKSAGSKPKTTKDKASAGKASKKSIGTLILPVKTSKKASSSKPNKGSEASPMASTSAAAKGGAKKSRK